ncbi:Aprataxin and PNK-like factor [Tupaia chinensis]|uniref:Aprataxin and PNK-like factor n=1 Tax=Tupaia chinensis TaxID=246437 RepID=L9KNQ1_TUPCH|nr:Aprataxin and PNK-like factor [Tupaia chinensis]
MNMLDHLYAFLINNDSTTSDALSALCRTGCNWLCWCVHRNSQMPSEDNLLNETPKSPAINLSDETTGATQLERSTEITKTQTTNTDSMEMPQSLPPNTLSNPEGNTKTKTKRSKISIKKVGEVSEHNNITKGAPDKEEAMSGSQSFSSAQGKSSNDESQGSHPESSSDSSNLETLHAKATDSVPEGPEDNKVKRTSCMYGANCYRKNPVHFQHFSHPGDSDYGGSPVMNQEDTDDRPECPYGASCYRKNPQHKIEFKHSTLPVRDALDEDDDVGQPSEYDLNDSFLDDEEEEYEPTDEDSDWEPGKEEQEKEDVEELLKEAKKFMKRKK